MQVACFRLYCKYYKKHIIFYVKFAFLYIILVYEKINCDIINFMFIKLKMLG